MILKFKSGTRDATKNGLQERLGLKEIETFESIGAELVALRDGMSVEAAIADALADPMVEYAEPDYEIHVARTPNDPRFGELYALHNQGQTGGFPGADIRMAEAWDVFTGNPAVKVGVIDTGVDYTHPDLAQNIWTNPGEIPANRIDDDHNGYVDDVHGYDFVNEDGDPMDDHGHGTHCAGTIGATGHNSEGIAGINWRCQIVAIKFQDAHGVGTLSDAIQAIQYAIRVGVAVTSNSYGGGGYSRAFEAAIAAAADANQMFVAAAGNSSTDNDLVPFYPASYESPNVVSVAATDHKDRLAGFSGFGATSVDLAAPGVGILSTKFGGGYLSSSGTSMAAPHVAGAAALVWGLEPSLSHAAVKERLLSGTDRIPGLAGRCVTSGRLNVERAIADLAPIPPAVLAVGPAELVARVAVGGAETHWLRIANTAAEGGASLQFTIASEVGVAKGAHGSDSQPAPQSPQAVWFSVGTTTGSVAADAHRDVAIRFATAGLAPGTYRAALRVRADSAPDAIVQVPVTMIVVTPTDTQDGLPLAFAIAAEQNPMPGGGRFRIAAPTTDMVHVRIYDVRGHEVARLVDGALPAGRHTVNWDGRDARGGQTASGVYFVRMSAARFQQTLRVTVLE